MAKLIEKDLEEAILGLPTKEKNKLLMRLINKDKVLVEQLHFKLLEHPVYDLRLREDVLSNKIRAIEPSPTDKAKAVLTLQRAFFAMISHHKRITGDKIGEVRLTTDLIYKFINSFELAFEMPDLKFHYKLNEYNIKKTKLLIKNLNALHEDYRIEFIEDINTILHFFHKGMLSGLAKSLELPRNLEY